MASLLKGVRAATAGLLIAVFAVPVNLIAQTHVVSEAELQKAATMATQARQQNIETIQQFLSSPQADKALKTAHINAQRVTQAVSRLDDQELANLAARARKAQADFAAGRLSDRDLIIILVAIAALILIIVAVR
jgi:CHASE1-domain containing sensor protein